MPAPTGAARPYADLPSLAWHRRSARGREWLGRLDQMVATCAANWALTLGAPFADGAVSLVLPATTVEGSSVVLKVSFPDDEGRYEGEALRAWDGDGAVRLLREDAGRRALLLERCDPGTPLTGVAPGDALDVLVDLLPRLWRPARPPFGAVADEAVRWTSSLDRHAETARRRFGRAAVERARHLLTELPASQGEQVLVHQDLHGGNVLAATRRPWLAIDPKPVVAEREFALAPIVRSPELGPGRRLLERRLDRLVGEFGLDRARAIGWTLAQTVAWGAGGDGPPGHPEVVAWLLDLG